MTSRLDRLFVLLETGSSAVTRRAAATQLGEVQRLYPHELHKLLGRLNALIRSPVWETRIAASAAVQAVLDSVPLWDPAGTDCKPEKDVWQSGRLTFSNFDLKNVISKSDCLMGSEGKEYDAEADQEGKRSGNLILIGVERLARERQQLNTRLLQLGHETTALASMLISAEDIKPSSTPQSPSNKLNVSEVVNVSGLSSREMNREKRKARQAMMRQKSRDASCDQPDDGGSGVEEPERKRIKQEEVEEPPTTPGESVPDMTGVWGPEAVDWPLESFAEGLCSSLFSLNWEVRHGAATALRELIRIHGRGAGKSADMPSSQMEEMHQSWLEDVSLRLVCVLALDRFGDYVSDQVVAPVRETCSQVIGSVVNLMSKERVEYLMRVLLQLLDHPDWEARHGGMLGLKYVLAVRGDLVDTLLPLAFPSILQGLSDEVDDVGSVAAAALIPPCTALTRLLPHHIPTTVQRLWDLLLLADHHELASCNSFMGLLAALLSDPNVQSLVSTDQSVVSRLWPFLSHNTSSVRKATLQTLLTLTGGRGTTHSWSHTLLQQALCHIYQRALIEPTLDLVENVWENLVRNSSLENLLLAVCPCVSTWLCLAMQPTKIAFDPSVLIQAKSSVKEQKSRNRNRNCMNADAGGAIPNCELKLYIGGSETVALATREKHAIIARCMAARMLGLLSCYIVKPAPGVDYTADVESPIDIYVKVICAHLNSKSALQRMVAGLVVAEFARIERPLPHPPALVARLHAALTENVYYDEISTSFIRLLQEANDFIATLKHYNIPFDQDAYRKVLTLEQIQQLSGPAFQQILINCKLKTKIHENLESRRKSIQGAVSQTSSDQQLLTISTQAALAGATLMLGSLPEKLNPVVKPLMEAIKKEENQELQVLAAKHLAELMSVCIDRNPCPNSKIIVNLCNFLRSDAEFTPKIHKQEGGGSSKEPAASKANSNNCFTNNDNYSGILTLINQHKSAEIAVLKRTNSSGNRGPGRPPITDIPLEELFAADDDVKKMNRIQRRGAVFALTTVASHCGSELPVKQPKLWEMMIAHLQELIDPNSFVPASAVNCDSVAEDLVSTLQILEVTTPALHSSLIPQRGMKSWSGDFKICKVETKSSATESQFTADAGLMTAVVERVLPLLAATHCDSSRQGAAEAIACLIDKLQFNIVPYVVLLVIPLLGRMSDQDTSVRQIATHCFATLIQLMPLDGAIPNPPALTAELTLQKDKDKAFLEQLFNPKTIEDYKVPVPINAQLRSYQQSGVNWLAFLNKYKLHGILCDDMGLGKTLQSICILAGDHYTRHQQYKATKSPDCVPLPSLVICPPTLTGHWVYEVEKFLSKKYLNPLHYAGPPVERERLRSKVSKHNLIIASYDIVRKDIDFFSVIKWNYVILDEGHVIKNGKTKSSKAIKQLTANHRLILSGTPIQNNVLELWSLLDFLMPGFLGTERQFTAKYSRPILASRDPKSSRQEQEAGVLAMEALHRQVLPFVLRRMKEDVLKDLPPKITQDYYCDLSPLQEQLYEDFTKSHAHQNLAQTIGSKVSSSLLQALRYLQNVCNHPKLVLTPQHPEYSKISLQMLSQNSSLKDINHAAKLPALKQLLLDCGIGSESSGSTAEPVVNQHRALIFCQLKAMLDILENDFFKTHMPSVSYLRLDGSIPPGARHSVVTQFNNDPSIDVLLLTTHVGGLGLNLTGADTVIFVEHDWSPMKDLQAMDRAHRIGQKKVVNVYRLITRATLEEKIMGLQKFKLMTANTVISSENSHMMTMGTDKLLDLFSLNKQEGSSSSATSINSPLATSSGQSMKSMMESLPDLWEDNCYQEEYDITNFIRNLKS
ncbi:TATA-binding protein-associated factor 172 [Nilaparvata lugens]|uniref:TATA-binding protein-associated factor 172 n=1 Tax=Nilaparvata lugens TaxID=108931 RepID=UPI00193E8D43|nr:TATA-binding protein-associated factor 172 [Nilaparvata lugens]